MTQWDLLLELYEDCELYKQDVVDLLRCGVTPPPEALPMIADILSDGGKPLKTTKRAEMLLIKGEGFIPKAPYAAAQVSKLHAIYGMKKIDAETYVSKAFGVSIDHLRRERTKLQPPKELKARAKAARDAYIERITNAWKS